MIWKGTTKIFKTVKEVDLHYTIPLRYGLIYVECNSYFGLFGSVFLWKLIIKYYNYFVNICEVLIIITCKRFVKITMAGYRISVTSSLLK